MWGYGTLSKRMKSIRKDIRRHVSLKDIGGIGRAVPLNAMSISWKIPPSKKESFMLLFKNQDRHKNGYLTGEEASMILAKSGLAKTVLAQIWKLCDQDGDGRVNADEFCAALWLAERATQGTPVPNTLPSDLIPAPSASGNVFSGLNSFEDKRKENFERGRSELERRKREIKEKEERNKAEQERIKMEEAEKKQREWEKAEQQRQAELLRQKQRALEIERERERQLQKLVLQREAEARELERKRHEEYIQQQRKELMMEKKEEMLAIEGLKSERRDLGAKLVSLAAEHATKLDTIKSHNRLCQEKRDDIAKLKTTCEIRQAELARLTANIQEWQVKLASCEREKKLLMKQQQGKGLSTNTTANEDVVRIHKACVQLQSSISKLKLQQSRQQEQLHEHQSQLSACKQSLKELEVTYYVEKKACEELSTQLEHRKAIAAKKIKDEEERALREQQKQREEERRLQQQKLKKQKEDEKKRKREEAERARFDEIRLLQEKENKEKIEQQKKEEDAKKLLERQQKEVVRKSHNETNWDELRKLQKKNVTPLPKPLQPLTKESVTPAGLPPKKKPAPPKPQPYKKHPPAITVTTESPSPPTDSWEANFKGITMVTSSQVATMTTESYYANISMATATVTSPTVTTPKASDMIEDLATVSLDDRYFNSAPDDILTQSTRVSATAELAYPHNEMVQYRALYDYTGQHYDELTFKEGDIINACDFNSTNPGWIGAELNGVQGLIPETYVEVITPANITKPLSPTSPTVKSPDAFSKPVISPRQKKPSLKSKSSLSTPDSPIVADRNTKQPLIKARALYTWQPSNASKHLKMKKGDIISVIEQRENWWAGKIDRHIGWFPKSYIEVIEDNTPSIATTSVVAASSNSNKEPTPTVSHKKNSTAAPLFEALYDYDGEREGDLHFRVGDRISVTNQAGNWWTGTLNGHTGVFPSNYVQPVRVTSPVSSVPSGNRSPKTVVAKVTVPYTAVKDNQLSLEQGQLIHVLEQDSSGWWKGQLHSRGKQRKVGWFPANRVELLSRGKTSPTNQESTDTPASSASSFYLSTHLSHSYGSNLSRLHVSNLSASSSSLGPTASTNYALALYSYTADNTDELTFYKGSVIVILNKDDPDWWKGEVNEQTGLVPANYVQELDDLQSSITSTKWKEAVSPAQLSKMTANEIKRQEAIFELITTEKSYVESLKLVNEVFFEPLSTSNVLTKQEFTQVLVNWPELIQCNSVLLSEQMIRLRISNMCVNQIGDILINSIPMLKPHIRWCSCQLNACTLLQNKSTQSQEFREFEQKCMTDPRTAGLPMSSFLLKPMQRVTKYPLLIDRIIKYTPQDHADMDDLKTSLEQAQKLCRDVNEGVRSVENTEHLEWIQSHVQMTGLTETLTFNSQTNHMGYRKILHWGRVFKLRGSRDLLCFLFNDFLLFCKPKHSFTRPATPSDFEPFGNVQYLLYKKPFLLNTVQVKKATSDSYPPCTFIVNITDEEKDMGLRVDSDLARDQWVTLITKAHINYLQKKKQMEKAHRERQRRSIKGSIAKLIVTVVEAADLKASDPNGKSDPFCVVRLGTQEQKTDVCDATLNPKWNKKMEFYVFDPEIDRIEVTVFDQDLFSPNDFLGSTSIKISELLLDGPSPWTKRQLLEHVHTGEIEFKLEYKDIKLL